MSPEKENTKAFENFRSSISFSGCLFMLWTGFVRHHFHQLRDIPFTWNFAHISKNEDNAIIHFFSFRDNWWLTSVLIFLLEWSNGIYVTPKCTIYIQKNFFSFSYYVMYFRYFFRIIFHLVSGGRTVKEQLPKFIVITHSSLLPIIKSDPFLRNQHANHPFLAIINSHTN